MFRDRIKELRRVRAGDLKPHPDNWREHPDNQRAALEGVLAEIGYADALLVRELPDGSLGIVDGHLRQSLDPDQEVPVLVLDLDESEAAKLLTVLDPLAAMAEANEEALGKLLVEIETDNEGLAAMLEELAADNGLETGVDGEEPVEDDTYTNKIISPVYEPKGEKPPLSALVDRGKTQELVASIDAAELPDDVQEFLRLAAERHAVFNFRQIAEFYCHADAVLQDLMERSGMVIIDYNKAIDYGFVHLTEKLGALADQEEADHVDA